MRTALLALLLLAPRDEKLSAPRVTRAPTLDGAGDDECWAKAGSVKLAVRDAMDPALNKKVVTIKACRTDDEIFFLVSWPDETASTAHKPWKWSQDKGHYVEGTEVEDSLLLAFRLEGEFDPNMLAGIESSWDAWHWKAARTNPAGYAQDRRHLYLLRKPDFKAAKYTGANGKDVWIARPEDEGKSTTAKAPKPAEKKDDVVPQHVAQAPDGSAADIRAKGAHKDGVWSVELARKLRTGHKDDTALEPGGTCPMAVAVLDASEEEHSVSGKFELVLEK
jgi:hypothetical protein